MPTLKEGPKDGFAVVDECLGGGVVVDFTVGTGEVGDGVAEVAAL